MSLSTLLNPFFCFLHGRLLLTKAHLVISFLISLLQRVVFLLISLRQHIVFLISSNPNTTRLCQPCSPLSFVFYMAICYSKKHILSSSFSFLFFNELYSFLFPYFSSSVHCLPYFFKLLVFLLISSNPNVARLWQPCSPISFVFYMAICYS
jgi:hypothetical protein